MADTSLPTLCWTALFNNSLVLIGVFDRVTSMAGPKAFWGVSRTLRMARASHQGNLVGWSGGWSPAHHGGQRPARCYGCQARPLELWSRPNDKAREPGTARARRKGRRAMATVRSPEGLLGRTSDGLEENEFFDNITCWIPLDLPEQTSAVGNIFGAKILLRAGHPPRKIFRHHDLGASFQPQHSMFVQTRKILLGSKTAKNVNKKTIFWAYGRCMGGVWEAYGGVWET